MIDALNLLAMTIGWFIIVMCALMWLVVISVELVYSHTRFGPDSETKRHDEPDSGSERDSLNDYVDATELIDHD